MALKVVCYINQFFAGLGGEDAAHTGPCIERKAVGPAMQIDNLLGGDGQVAGTVICGDSYYGEHIEEAREKCLEYIREMSPDLFFAGPAFNAGRYGVACGDIAAAVAQKLGIPCVTGMYSENPGAELYRSKTFIVKTADSARGMKQALEKMVELGKKLVSNEPLRPADEEGYFHRGIRKNYFHERNGAQRAVDMLLRKISEEDYRTEYEMPVFKRIKPAEPVKDLSKATVALVTSGGIVPRGNPDRIRVSSAETYGKYDISGIEDLTPEIFESVHGGYDRVWANDDPDVVLPVDVLREMEREGVFGKLYDYIFTTTGTGTAVANAERFGREIGEQLKKDGVDAVILTSA